MVKDALAPRKRRIRAKKRGEYGGAIGSLAAKKRQRRSSYGIRGKAKVAMLKARRTGLWRKKRKKK